MDNTSVTLKSIRVQFGEIKYKHLITDPKSTFGDLKAAILAKLKELGHSVEENKKYHLVDENSSEFQTNDVLDEKLT